MSALELSIQLYAADLRRYARSLLGNIDEAEALVRECLAEAATRSHVWSRLRDPRAALFAILHGLYAARPETRQAAIRHEGAMAGVELAALDEALAQLPPEEREAVLLVGLDGMSYQQAAETLDLPLGAVMSRLARGRERLRQLTDNAARLPAVASMSAAVERRAGLRAV
jgi:RNA polymerase sigma-70 factor (ECF subfamily)